MMKIRSLNRKQFRTIKKMSILGFEADEARYAGRVCSAYYRQFICPLLLRIISDNADERR